MQRVHLIVHLLRVMSAEDRNKGCEEQRKQQCGVWTRLSSSNEETLATIERCSPGPLAVFSSSRGTVPYLQHSGLPAARG
jgi:hypothetical protein